MNLLEFYKEAARTEEKIQEPFWDTLKFLNAMLEEDYDKRSDWTNQTRYRMNEANPNDFIERIIYANTHEGLDAEETRGIVKFLKKKWMKELGDGR